ncbi:hypothetical protein ALC60_02030 [Trachymyrmex zeteki]|uniref:Uncharacterized protein n=1 Tax=Mycetomoellerius zeteki TaxID=64791 RepID=A0A151XEZ4_9HYME|nr:hypothetical protein ALC60_02030 [Trachymyrmex zeteki]
MSNIKDILIIKYEYPVEGYLMVDNEKVRRLYLKNELGVQIIPLVSFF